MKNLKELTPAEFKEFLNSFDTVITDIDGVLQYPVSKSNIDKTVESVKEFRRLNKKIVFVSNNTFKHPVDYLSRLSAYDANIDEIVYPSVTIAWYLKKINFQKKAFVIGSKFIREYLEKEGIILADRGPEIVSEDTLEEEIEHLKNDPDVGAVIVDADLLTNYTKLGKAYVYLKQQNVLFIVGSCSLLIPVNEDFRLLGAGLFSKLLETVADKKAMVFGKPGIYLYEFLKEKFSVDPNKTLVIGDTLGQDIYFGNQFGFKTLFVLTGINGIKDLENAQKDHKPQYYINSLGDIYSLINNLVKT